METLFKVGGKIFTDLEEAKSYESELKAKEERILKLRAEENNRLEEIRNAEIHLTELYDKFVEDYGYININLEVPECVFDDEDDECDDEVDCDGDCGNCELNFQYRR